MAAPQTITIPSLNGQFTMNKTTSDDFMPILSLQGVGWLVRKAIGMMNVVLNITTSTDAQGNTVIHIVQPGVAGVKGTEETFVLDGQPREHTDHVFGAVKGKTVLITVSDLKDSDEDEAFLKQGWAPETAQGQAVDSFVESKGNGWTARQIWGFKEKNGARVYARNVVVRKGKEVKRVQLYYDYTGEAQKV